MKNICIYHWRILDTINPFEWLTFLYENPSSKDEDAKDKMLSLMWKISKASLLLCSSTKTCSDLKEWFPTKKHFLFARFLDVICCCCSSVYSMPMYFPSTVNDLQNSQKTREMRHKQAGVRECLWFILKYKWSWTTKGKIAVLKLEKGIEASLPKSLFIGWGLMSSRFIDWE